jgi:hypothetical protein
MRIYQNTECKILWKSYVAKNRQNNFDQLRIINVYKNVKNCTLLRNKLAEWHDSQGHICRFIQPIYSYYSVADFSCI